VIVVRYLQRFGPIHHHQVTAIGPGLAQALGGMIDHAISDGAASHLHIDVAASIMQRQNPGHDPQLWQIALDRVADMERAAHRPDLPLRLEDFVGQYRARHGRPPCPVPHGGLIRL
jgi:hypothetical protein